MLPIQESLPSATINRVFIESHTFLVNPKTTNQVISLNSLKGCIKDHHIFFYGKLENANVINLASNTKIEELFKDNSMANVPLDTHSSIQLSDIRYLHTLDQDLL